MEPSHPPEDGRNRKTLAALRKMGIALSVLGTIIFVAGLVVCRHNSDGKPSIRNIAMLLFAIALFVAGLYTWRNAKMAD